MTTMDQEHFLPGPHEPLTEVEVRALVERFGERHVMAQDYPRVQDVAEALDVDPATVGEMLREVRESKDEHEVNQRLDKLEKENAELRERTPVSAAFHAPFPDASVRVPFLFSMAVSILAVLVGTEAFGLGAHSWFKQFSAVALLFGLLFPTVYFIGRRLFRTFKPPGS